MDTEFTTLVHLGKKINWVWGQRSQQDQRHFGCKHTDWQFTL